MWMKCCRITGDCYSKIQQQQKISEVISSFYALYQVSVFSSLICLTIYLLWQFWKFAKMWRSNSILYESISGWLKHWMKFVSSVVLTWFCQVFNLSSFKLAFILGPMHYIPNCLNNAHLGPASLACVRHRCTCYNHANWPVSYCTCSTWPVASLLSQDDHTWSKRRVATAHANAC